MISTADTSLRKITTVDTSAYLNPDDLFATYITVIDIYNNTLDCNCHLLTSWYNFSQNFTTEKTLLDQAKCI